MTVAEVVRFCRPLYPSWDDALGRELLRSLALQEGKRVGELSKGMATKLHLLLATAHRPRVLLLDEPLSGLDPVVREEFTEGILRGAGEEERTVVISSHQIGDVQRLADRVGILHKGRLLLEDSVDDLLENTRLVEVVLAPDHGPTTAPAGTVRQRRDRRRWTLTIRSFTPAVVREIRERHSVQDVEVRDLDLEGIFKEMVLGHEEAA
jgi:ABC-2 type transport system ATP-binding protein